MVKKSEIPKNLTSLIKIAQAEKARVKSKKLEPKTGRALLYEEARKRGFDNDLKKATNKELAIFIEANKLHKIKIVKPKPQLTWGQKIQLQMANDKKYQEKNEPKLYQNTVTFDKYNWKNIPVTNSFGDTTSKHILTVQKANEVFMFQSLNEFQYDTGFTLVGSSNGTVSAQKHIKQFLNYPIYNLSDQLTRQIPFMMEGNNFNISRGVLSGNQIKWSKKDKDNGEDENSTESYNIIHVKNWSTMLVPKVKLDLLKLPMFACTFQIENEHVSNFIDSGNNMCVPETLFHLYCTSDAGCKRPLKKLTIKKIINIMRPDEKDSKSGFSIEEIKRFCEYYKIPMHALAIDMKVLDSYYPGKDSKGKDKRNKKLNVLSFIMANGHMYLLKNDNFTKGMQQKMSSSHIIQKKCKTEIDLKDIIKKSNLNDELVDYIVKTGKIPDCRSISVVNGNIKKMRLGEQLFHANAETDTVLGYIDHYNKTMPDEVKKRIKVENMNEAKKEIKQINKDTNAALIKTHGYIKYKINDCEKQDHKEYIQDAEDKIPSLPFTNQSVLNFGRLLFSSLYPNHEKSKMNKFVYKHIQVNGGIVENYNISQYACFELDTLQEDTHTVSIDVNKCRTSCLKNNRLGKYKRFNVMCDIEIYEPIDTLREGYYYILTENRLPAQGNKWYTNGFLEYLTKENIPYVIKYQLLASDTYPEDYLVKLFDNMITYPNFKEMSNGTIGSFAMTKTTHSKVKFEKDFNTVCHLFNTKYDQSIDTLKSLRNGKVNNNGIIEETHIKLIELPHDEKLYQIESKTTIQSYENDVSIYNHVCENERIIMYELNKKLNGRIICIRTDNIVVEDPKGSVELSTKIGGYKQADIIYVTEKSEHTNKELNLNFKEWATERENEFFDDQGLIPSLDNKYHINELADHILSKNKGCFVDGPGGFGKSTLLKTLCQKLDEQKKTYVILAPTNVASLNVDGETIHKFLGLNEDLQINPKMLQKARNLEFIMIDEISMVNEDLLNLVQLIKCQNKKVKIIIYGHFWQLPPVKSNCTNFKKSYIMKWLCDFNRFKMTINKRSDTTMTELCFNQYKHGILNINSFNNDQSDCDLHLTYTNLTRKVINKKYMEARETKTSLIIKYTEQDKKENIYCQNVILNVGTPIISCKNWKANDIYNGEQFVIKSWDNEDIFMRNIKSNKEIFIKHSTFHKLFVVCYAMTIHKSQGQTFNFRYCIHEYNHPNMSRNALYVALSRTTDKKNVCFGR